MYVNHLQDVWYDGAGTLWWAHTYDLLKTDAQGNILASAVVEGHHAGLEVRGGVLYVAVCPSEGQTEVLPFSSESRLQVNEYDPETLALRAERILDINDRAGSLAVLPDGTFVVGCLRPAGLAPDEVRFHHLTPGFKPIASHVVKAGRQDLGIEVIRHVGDDLFLYSYTNSTRVTLDARTFAPKAIEQNIAGQTGVFFAEGATWNGITEYIPEKGGYVSRLERA